MRTLWFCTLCLLVGCSPKFEQVDGDGDGSLWPDDCNDDNAEIGPEAEEIWYDGVDQDCAGDDDFDQDGDGFVVSEECDDEDPSLVPDLTIEEIWYDGLDQNCDGNDGDRDGDGFVPDDYAETQDWQAHVAHQGTGDCWDDDPSADVATEDMPINDFGVLGPEDVHPDATERWYDGVDQDCNGDSDFDQDADSYNTEFYVDREGQTGGDCVDGAIFDDENPAGLAEEDIHPEADENWYDGTDQDCAGDDDYDQDGDGHAVDGSGDDCDDGDPGIHPEAQERCDTPYDDDCDDDDNDPDAYGCDTFYLDADGDEVGVGDGHCLCEEEEAYTARSGGDCDDTDPNVSPELAEVPGDGVDEDCDGQETCWVDADGDGYHTGDDAPTDDLDCDDATEGDDSTLDGDCDDADPAISPAAEEQVDDGVDGDCDGYESCWADADGDGYHGDELADSVDTDCADPGEASSDAPDGDCDDTEASAYPGGADTTGDGIDGDCDGTEICWVDADRDGYRGSGTVASADGDCDDRGEADDGDPDGDCDDDDDEIHPDATDAVGDGVDQDCDGYESCWADADGDGVRSDETVLSADGDCDDSGEADDDDTDGDCDDGDSSRYPGAEETCEDGVINACEGEATTARTECFWDRLGKAAARRSGAEAGDRAGDALSFIGDIDGDGDDEIMIGAPDAGSGYDYGRAYVLVGSPSGESSLSKSSSYNFVFRGESSGDALGTSLGGAFDLNGDGYADLAFGATEDDDGGNNAGAAYFIESPPSASGTLSSSVYTAKLIGSSDGDAAGYALAAVPDQHGDGYDELLLGAPEGTCSSGGTDAGCAYLVMGPLTSSSVDLDDLEIGFGGSYPDELASSAMASADLDADGTADVVVGAREARMDDSEERPGRAYIVLGPAEESIELAYDAHTDLQGVADGDGAGYALSCADVSGDGAADLLIGAPYVDADGVSSVGAAYLILGGEDLPEGELSLSSADAVLTGGDTAVAGFAVASADLDGDNYAEVLVGAPDADAPSTDSGAVYLHFGPTSGAIALEDADVTLKGEAEDDALGSRLAAGGDPNSDGYLDLLVSAPLYDASGASSAGLTYLMAGVGY